MKKSEIFNKNKEDLHLTIVNEINSLIEKIKEKEESDESIELKHSILYNYVDDQASEEIDEIDTDIAKVYYMNEHQYDVNLYELPDHILIAILEDLEEKEAGIIK